MASVKETKMPKKTNFVRYRSAKTGLFVTERYARLHPATTIKEHARRDTMCTTRINR
jgi:hypothetical protein